MRVLMICDFYWPLLGGVEQHVRTLAHELADRSHEVTVVTSNPGGLAETEFDGPVEVVRITGVTHRMDRLFSQSRPWSPPIHDPVALRRLRRILRERDPEVVHSHDWLGRSAMGVTSGRPLISTLHYYTLSCAKKDLMQGDTPCDGPAPLKCVRCAAAHYGPVKGVVTAAANAAGAAIERRTASHIIAVSRSTAIGNGLDPHEPNVHVIPNFLASGKDAVEALDSERMSSLPDEPFFLYVGDFRPTKGFDVLLEAYAGGSVDRPLVVIGKRWPSAPFERPDGVIVLEEWPNSDVMSAFERAWAAVVPSRWAEPFGIVAIEAMSRGVPVIASEAGGLADIVTDSVDGLLVAPGSVDELRAAMHAVDRSSSLRARLADGAKVRSGAYTADTVVPQIEAVYERAIEEARRP